MSGPTDVIAEGLPILERTPGVLSSLLRGLPEAWVRFSDRDGSWSAYDVLGHLIHGEETDWIPRARVILEQGEARPFEPFDRLAQARADQTRPLGDLLDGFAALRRRNLETLRHWNLQPEDLARRGRHPALGLVTLRQLLATWVAHDLAHLAQTGRVLARRLAAAAGPWNHPDYMPVFHRP